MYSRVSPRAGQAHSLRVVRAALNLTRPELARRAGVSEWIVKRVEEGHVEPRFDEALKIADAVGVPVERLFGRGSMSLVDEMFSGRGAETAR